MELPGAEVKGIVEIVIPEAEGGMGAAVVTGELPPLSPDPGWGLCV